MTAGLQQIQTSLTTQWSRMMAWVEPLGDDLLGTSDNPSVLNGWTNGELVAHLGRAMEALVACRPAPAGTIPLTLAEYLGTYPERSADITRVTRELAQEISQDPLAQVDALAQRAFAALDSLGPDGDLVVQARRGPIRLRDMAMSRLIELVVHAEDLVDSLKGVADSLGSANPIDRTAQRVVAEELLEIVVARGGWSLELTDAKLWIRLATGRTPYHVGALTQAVAPSYTAGGVPDLGRVLPIL